MRKNAFTFISLLSLTLSVPTRGAESSCDHELLERAKGTNSTMAYRDRGDRCEGIYAQQVGTVTLQVRSLTWGGFDFDPESMPTVPVAWTPPSSAQGAVRLRAFSFKPRTYYRMDASFPVAQGRYLWPTEVLSKTGMERGELGVVAWMDKPPRGTDGEVYLPVQLGMGSRQEATVKVVPSERLRELRVSVARLEIDTGKEKVLRDNEELDYGYYPSGQPVEFGLGELQSGFYRVKAKAFADGDKGNPAIADFIVYISKG